MSPKILWNRVLIVWFVMLFVESLHGIFRRLVLEPAIGDLPARQISVLTGSVLIFLIALGFSNWLGTKHRRSLLKIGLVWAVLTLIFEISFGRMAGASWSRIASDFDPSRGGWLSLGILFMGFSPLIASKFRRRTDSVEPSTPEHFQRSK